MSCKYFKSSNFSKFQILEQMFGLLFDFLGVEIQIETVGIGVNINLISATSIMFGGSVVLENGVIRTNAFVLARLL